MEANKGFGSTAWPFDTDWTNCIIAYKLQQYPGRHSPVRSQGPQHYLHHHSPAPSFSFFCFVGGRLLGTEFRLRKKIDLKAEVSTPHCCGLINMFVSNFSKKYLAEGTRLFFTHIDKDRGCQHLLWYWVSLVEGSASTITTAMVSRPSTLNSAIHHECASAILQNTQTEKHFNWT